MQNIYQEVDNIHQNILKILEGKFTHCLIEKRQKPVPRRICGQWPSHEFLLYVSNNEGGMLAFLLGSSLIYRGRNVRLLLDIPM
jgi:hypothetical protein